VTTIAVIPARFASTRFPGKPLASQTGKYLIQHVWEQARAARRIDRVIVATDDERIATAVRSFGGEVWLTAADHPSGTSRVLEVVGALRLADRDVVLNVQGDEPELAPAVLDQLVSCLEQGETEVGIATLAARFAEDGPRDGAGSPADPNCVKVVVDARGRALYFSRSLIPYPRATGGRVDRPSRWLLHLGVYAFRAGTLHSIGTLAGSGDLDATESLEQLRWLQSGLEIGVLRVDHAFVGIDTPEDYAAFVARGRGRAGEVGGQGRGVDAATCAE